MTKKILRRLPVHESINTNELRIFWGALFQVHLKKVRIYITKEDSEKKEEEEKEEKEEEKEGEEEGCKEGGKFCQFNICSSRLMFTLLPCVGRNNIYAIGLTSGC